MATITVYGYPIGLFYGGSSFKTKQEAEELQNLVGGNAMITPHERKFCNEGHNPWWDVEPVPHYNYTTSRDKAVWQHENGRCYEPYRSFNLITVKVEALATQKDKLFVYGKLPLVLGGGQDENTYTFIGLREYSPLRSGVNFSPVIPDVPELSEESAKLINSIKGADGGTLTGVDYRILAEIEDLVSERSLIKNRQGHRPYASDEVMEHVYRLKNGQLLELFSYSVGYSEGYQFDVFGSEKEAKDRFREHLKARAKADWILTECLECGASYKEFGHVEPGGMGCDRCN